MAMSRSPIFDIPNTYRAFYGAFPYLHDIQKEAIEPVMEGLDLILQSATGSGKTEAVLAPCLEGVIRSGRKRAVLYIVPTRALALDLMRRLDPVLTQRLGLALSVRTGDIKRAGGGRPDLILTTPESLDVMIGSPNRDLQQLLQRIRSVIIDEVHPLVYQYRGRQLSYLLRRLERRQGSPLQRIALSATIADADAVVEFFGFRPDTVRLVTAVQREISPHLVHLKDDENELVALLDDLYEKWDYRKVLVFANSRGRCDRLFALLSLRGRFQNVCELHYSNLKTRERRDVEHRFRKRSHALCIATSTLELGIDVGDVDGVVLFEPPDSVSSFLQRIGRSNRRGTSTRFWGICRGERAGSQLLRFLGLLRSARTGGVEAPRSAELPSVLVQQILSCLYEKKRISLPAVSDLFPERAQMLPSIFKSLEEQGWLREDKTLSYQPSQEHNSCNRAAPSNRLGPRMPRILRGGWRYRDCFIKRRIWSNFPEPEEEYSLDLSGEAVADLPKSIVKQLDPGDRVYLAGKRIQILQIVDTGERKRVLAQPADRLDEKELFWLGAGSQVSYEVAQSIRTVLKSPPETADATAFGLFARTRRLLQSERSRAESSAQLANGMEVSREPTGLFRYWTFLGSVGNLILRWAIEDSLQGKTEGPDNESEEIYVTSDETAIESSQQIDFRKLHLPLDRNAFELLVRENIKSIFPLVSLNSFCEALPFPLLVQELSDFLFDSRIARAFMRFTTEPSEMVSGNRSIFDLPWVEPEAPSSSRIFLDTSQQTESLLEWEKKRWNVADSPVLHGEDKGAGLFHAPKKSYRLTGTIIGEYIRHRQCKRWLTLSFLDPDRQPPRRTLVDTELGALRTESGRLHEKRVLDHLKNQGLELIEIGEAGARAGASPLKERFSESIDRLSFLIGRVEAIRPKYLYLAQAVLMVQPICGSENGNSHFFDGVGIPDLIRVSITQRGPMLEVGDIKDSPAPHYSQKWQVAFYTLLLGELIRSKVLRAELASTGFIITRPVAPSTEPTFHSFDLRPFMAAFPSLLENMEGSLLDSSGEASCRLREHCTGCPWFEYCYRIGLENEDILFVPELSEGAFEKLRLTGIKTIRDASERVRSEAASAEVDEKTCLELSSRQKERIEGRLEALMTNRISLYKKKTRLYPANISTPIFLHILKDPLTGLPRLIGLRIPDALDTAKKTGGTRVWTIASEKDLPFAWESFSRFFLDTWKSGIKEDGGPHIFHFGKKSRELLFEWENLSGGADLPVFLREGGSPHFTDLRRLILNHFDFPAPGALSLFSIGRILGFGPKLEEPESLFHTEDDFFVSPGEWREQDSLRRDGARRIEDALLLQEKTWQWAQLHLESDVYLTREDFEPLSEEEPSPGPAYLRFLDEEKRLHEEDVTALQELSLRERVERFRAIGPLEFVHASLDDEGRFLYSFKTAKEDPTGFSKFREGDFLKLAPMGTVNLQSGLQVILRDYDRNEGVVSVLSRQGRLALSKRLTYSLEEDLTDWNGPRLAHVVRTVFPDDKESLYERAGLPSLEKLLQGDWPVQREREHLDWIKRWLSPSGADFNRIAGLNSTQKRALELPFRSRLGVIEGPPGTGKTHLLAWILIALVLRAREAGQPLRIAVSALTHQAIDQVLGKVVELVNRHDLLPFPARCLKLGRWKNAEENVLPGGKNAGRNIRVEPLTGRDEISGSSFLILGATGYGLYQLFNSRQGEFPRAFDWVVFDEASQILIPHALLGLIYGRGNFLFIGDEKQLPPIVLGNYEPDTATAPQMTTVHRSILARILELYGPDLHVRLDETYRMNRELCRFPSKTWYDGALRSAPANAGARLVLTPADKANEGGKTALSHSADFLDRILDPEKPAALVLADHRGCHQRSPTEVEIVSELACRLMIQYGLEPHRLALISPHRAQNNAIADRLAELLLERGYSRPLPLIDTVERVQGAERDVVLFSFTTSDPDHLMSEFLNNPNRFNVAITRARLKLIVVGSLPFFSAVPNTEIELGANRCFKEFARFCREHESLFIWK